MGNSNRSYLQAKIEFLEAQLDSLTHYLPETYRYLIKGLVVHHRALAKIQVYDTFDEIDRSHSCLMTP